MMSATCAKPSVRRRCCAAVGENAGERILALDAALVEVARAVGAEHDRAVLGRAHEQPADVRVLAQRREQLAGGARSISSSVSRRGSSIR